MTNEHLTEASHKALQNAGIPSRITDGMLEYKVPDVKMLGVDKRGDPIETDTKIGGWTSCHITSANLFAAKLRNSRINVTEQDILACMSPKPIEQPAPDVFTEETIAAMDEVVEVDEQPKKMGRPKGSKNIVKTHTN